MKTHIYYNEYDPYCIQWLANLMNAGYIPEGVLDGRDIHTVRAADLVGASTCHFFAGIGGWPYAMQLAGWPTTRPLWTASCPCQPFSNAGQRRGASDTRHLWPVLFRLIQECHPDTIVGEQVASAIGHGWIDGISTDLEQEGYTVGAIVLGAHSVGAPHLRQRLYWVANTSSPRLERRTQPSAREECATTQRSSDAGRVDDASQSRKQRLSTKRGTYISDTAKTSEISRMADARFAERREDSPSCFLERIDSLQQKYEESTTQFRTSREINPWNDYVITPCRDGKSRRVEPGLQCVVNGVPFRLADGRTRENVSRQGLLKGFGNAIVPQVAAAFLWAFLAAEEEM